MNATLLLTQGKTISLNSFPPYNLNNRKENSDLFYLQLETVTNQVVEIGLNHFRNEIRNFMNSETILNKKMKISENEHLLEILMIGVFWNTYQGRWRWNIGLISPFFKFLNSFRSTNLKKGVDSLRGLLGSALLNKTAKKNLPFDLDNFNSLIHWLSATGDFEKELKMIDKWLDFLYFDGSRISYEFLAEASAYAEWFEAYTKSHLGIYTENVEPFLQQNKKIYKGREDQFFCLRSQVEYHLNMVGAQIMNNSLKEEFLRTDKQILLLPTCMAKSSNCKATLTGNALQCNYCSSGCSIAKTSAEMRKIGVETVLIKHSTDFSEWLKPWANQSKTGLIGTACVLNLLGGGYEMKQLGIPSQCVYLNNSGCKKHWNKTGVPTEINIDRVSKLLTRSDSTEKFSQVRKAANSMASAG
jgi:hypothetical protein